jgi:hypothetical protein
MVLMPMAECRPNFLDETIKNLLENRKMHVAAFVCEYDSDCCLLSDRGFSQPIADGPHMAFSFNLCATAFVDYIFADPATLVHGKGPGQQEISRKGVGWVKGTFALRGPTSAGVQSSENRVDRGPSAAS